MWSGVLECDWSLYLIAEQNALQTTVDGLHIILSSHLKQVLLWGQQLLRGFLQQGSALCPIQRTQVWHLVTPNLKCPREGYKGEYTESE